MKEILLGFWFFLQALTAPFFPDPKAQVKAAEDWIAANLKAGDQLTPELIERIEAEGFRSVRDTLQLKQAALNRPEWKKLPVQGVVYVVKTIPMRPTVGVTDVTAWVALSADDRILHVLPYTGKVYL